MHKSLHTCILVASQFIIFFIFDSVEACQFFFPLAHGSTVGLGYSILNYRRFCSFCWNQEQCKDIYNISVPKGFHGCIGPYRIEPDPIKTCQLRNKEVFDTYYYTALNDSIRKAQVHHHKPSEEFLVQLRSKYYNYY